MKTLLQILTVLWTWSRMIARTQEIWSENESEEK